MTASLLHSIFKVQNVLQQRISTLQDLYYKGFVLQKPPLCIPTTEYYLYCTAHILHIISTNSIFTAQHLYNIEFPINCNDMAQHLCKRSFLPHIIPTSNNPYCKGTLLYSIPTGHMESFTAVLLYRIFSAHDI